MLILRLASYSLFFALLWAAPSAQAQPFGKTVVVVYGGPKLDAAFEAAAHIERDLSSRRIGIISMHDARDRFLTRSRAPQSPSGSELEALARQAHDAVEHVALGRTAAAQKSVRDIIALAERSLESLNRETKTARQLLDACLALVRASVHAGKRDLAIDQAMGCRRLVPDLSPSESAHPANVVGVLAEADDQLRRMRLGSLYVRDRGDRACSVYLNGRHLGTTPFTLDQASVGEYRVQVECAPERAGRVHVVHLGDAPVQLTVDTSFDESVRTEPRLSLQYDDLSKARTSVVEHAKLLGAAVRADDVLLVEAEESSVTLLRVHARHQRLIGAVQLSRAAEGNAIFAPRELGRALDALSEARFVGLTAAHFAPVASAPSLVVVPTHEGQRPAQPSVAAPIRTEADPPSRRKPTPLYKRWWLWTAVGVAVAAGVTAAVVIANREDEGTNVPEIDARRTSNLQVAW